MSVQPSSLDTLLQAGILAPSGDNTQPWRFILDRGQQTVYLDIDASRDSSPMNAGQTMARISLGCVLENMVRTAESNHWAYVINESPTQGLVSIRLTGDCGVGEIDPLLSRRVTNRRIYEGTPISSDCLARLRQQCDNSATIRTELITDPQLLAKLTELIGRADAIILGTQQIRNAFLAKVRFDQPIHAEVDVGLSLGSLEVGLADRTTLRLLNKLPMPDSLLRMLGARRVFSRVAAKLASSASGLCLITSANTPGALDDIAVGKAWQRIWLNINSEGLAAQPMMSLLVLQNIITSGRNETLSDHDNTSARCLLQEFENALRQLSTDRPAAMMRFGNAEEPTSRVGRLNLARNLHS